MIDAAEIVRMTKEIYEKVRNSERSTSPNEKLLFAAACALEKSQAQLAVEQEKHRWRAVDDTRDEEIEWDVVVETIEHCAKIPVFMTMGEIFLDEESEVSHWRPICLPEEDEVKP